MSVTDRSYRAYAGPITAERTRFLVLTRFAWAQAFRSRLVLLVTTAAGVTALAFAVIIYLHHNLSALEMLDVRLEQLVPIDETFFFTFLIIQCAVAFFLTALIGPGLVSGDLAHGALPLYLARPLSRTEYILGKALALATILSLVTWVPGLLLVALQSFLAPGWLAVHARIPFALLTGAAVWIVTFTLLVLAISAWVRWRPVAGAMLFAVVFVGAGLGTAIAVTLELPAGNVVSLGAVFRAVWGALFGLQARGQLSPALGAFGLAGFAALSLFLLSRRVRPQEVVR